jgi:hypothetical protein
MMGISEMQRMIRLEREVEELKARLTIVERAESYENSDALAPRRRPVRPRKDETLPPAA